MAVVFETLILIAGVGVTLLGLNFIRLNIKKFNSMLETLNMYIHEQQFYTIIIYTFICIECISYCTFSSIM